MHRRNLLKGAVLGATCFAMRPALSLAADADAPAGADEASARLAALERRHGGRLGVAILDTGSGRRATHRDGERFLMCSTAKLLAVAAVLARVDHGAQRLDRRIVFGRETLLSYAPVTRQHVGAPGMSVAELCQAAIEVSDNTALNLLLASLGGPAKVTAFARTLGDDVTRLDRFEPELNDGAPGDQRDTTTPGAMLATMHALLLGDVLGEASRKQLLAWLRACITGTDKLRAGLPPGWTAGDKTGSGSHGESNDVAILFPPGREPVLVTAYYAAPDADQATRSAVLAAVGRIAASI